MRHLASLLLLAAALPAQDTQPKASIEGVVLTETTNAPVRRAEIALMKTGSAAGTSMIMSTGPATSAVTDAEGKFRVADLEPGAYHVTVRKQGMMMPRTAASSSLITLTPGQELKGLRYILQPQAIISGRVLDDEGEPVQGAQVQVLSRRMMRGKLRFLPAGPGSSTNDRGEFRIINVQPGRHIVGIVFLGQTPPTGPAEPGKPALGLVPTYYPSVTDTAQATALDVAAGAELNGIDIRLQRVPVFTLRGKALDVNGAPLTSDFFVNVMPRDNPGYSNTGRMSARRQDGSFEITGVPNGAHTLVLRVMNRSNPSDQQVVVLPIDVNGADIEGLTLRRQPPVVLQGTVTVEGAPAEKAQAVIASMRISLSSSGDVMPYAGSMPAQVKDDGAFTLNVPFPGLYRVQPFVGAAADFYLAEIRAGSTDLLAKDLDLTAGSPGPISIVYRTGGATLNATIAQSDSATTGAAMIFLLAKDPGLRESQVGRRTAQVNKSGASSLSNLRPGDYLALAVAGAEYNSSFIQDPQWIEANLARFQKITLAPGQSQSLALTPIPAPPEPQ